MGFRAAAAAALVVEGGGAGAGVEVQAVLVEADAGFERDRVLFCPGVVGVGEGERAVPGGALMLVDGAAVGVDAQHIPDVEQQGLDAGDAFGDAGLFVFGLAVPVGQAAL